MNISLLRSLTLAFVICTVTVLLSGCVSTGGYYDDGGIGAAYYESSDVFYGGWGPGYHVAPFRGDEHREHRQTSGGGRGSERTFKSSPASHPAPSIPSQSRSGGSRSGESRSGESRSGDSHSGGSHSR